MRMSNIEKVVKTGLVVPNELTMNTTVKICDRVPEKNL
jgi:hypothetical protein